MFGESQEGVSTQSAGWEPSAAGPQGAGPRTVALNRSPRPSQALEQNYEGGVPGPHLSVITEPSALVGPGPVGCSGTWHCSPWLGREQLLAPPHGRLGGVWTLVGLEFCKAAEEEGLSAESFSLLMWGHM